MPGVSMASLPPATAKSKAPALANPYIANAATGAALGGLKYGGLDERAAEAALGAVGGAAAGKAGRCC